MKKFKLTSVILIAIVGFLFSCTVAKNDLAGKWEKENTPDMKLVLEITTDNSWNYFKNDTLVEKGTLEIKGDDFIMKHAHEEHSHAEGAHHSHDKPADHVYKFSLNEDKNELSFITDKKTTVYKKVQ